MFKKQLLIITSLATTTLLQANWSILSPSMSSAAAAIKSDVQSKFQTYKDRVETIKDSKNKKIKDINIEKIKEYNKYLIVNKKNALIQKKLQFTISNINALKKLKDEK